MAAAAIVGVEAVGGVMDFISNHPDLIMFSIGAGSFLISYIIASKVTPAPNNNLWYLLGPGNYVDAATGQLNEMQVRQMAKHESVEDKIRNGLADAFGVREKPILRPDPKDGGLKYYINGKYYTIAEVKTDIDNGTIPDAWGTEIDLTALRAEIARSHLDVNGNPIISPDQIPKGTNVAAFNNMSKAEATQNKGPLLGNGALEFVQAHPELISQAYPGRDVQALTDDDIVHVYNQIYVGAADRRKNDAGAATRVDIAKWVNFKHQNAQRLAQYEQHIIDNNLKWKQQVTNGKFDNRVGLQTQLSQKSPTADAATPMPISKRR